MGIVTRVSQEKLTSKQMIVRKEVDDVLGGAEARTGLFREKYGEISVEMEGSKYDIGLYRYIHESNENSPKQGGF